MASLTKEDRIALRKAHRLKAEQEALAARGSSHRLFSLAEMMIVLIIIGLIASGVVVGRTTIESARINAQATQIAQFDSAVVSFHDKYHGMPGDLLSSTAEKYNLPASDGSDTHGDGDGKIVFCNTGALNLGCESALFWAQLGSAGYLTNAFSADIRFRDNPLASAHAMDAYLPVSPIANGIYITVWNADAAVSYPTPHLPYGNYFEITGLGGVTHERLQDAPLALTPSQAKALDSKMDDNLPRTGRIVVNGTDHAPDDSWGTFAKGSDNNCVLADDTYNAYDFFKSSRPLCHLAVAFSCCGE